MNTQDNIREICKSLLEEGVVNLIIGYGQGTLPYATQPILITSPEKVNQLIWSPFCRNNLALYVQHQAAANKQQKNKGDSPLRIGVVAKKCDMKALVELLRENQIKRENIFIIGVDCSGVIDKQKILDLANGREILNIDIQGDKVTLSGRGWNLITDRDELLRDNCLVCSDPGTLPLVDEMISGDNDYTKPTKEDDFTDVKIQSALSAQERWDSFRDEFENCIRCNACRNACPLCYCAECFAECTKPRWLGPSVELKDALVFQMVRVLHQAGRCVDCGACVSACPMGLDIRKYTHKLNLDARELFHFESGLSAEEKALLATFSPEDKQDFISEP